MNVALRWLAILCTFSFLVACAHVPPHQKVGVEIDTLYKFDHPRLDFSLYVKFLPVDEDEKSGRLLFTTLPKGQDITDIKHGDPKVFLQEWFIVSKGEVVFRYRQKGRMKELVKDHPFFTSGSSYKGESSLRYTLNFNEAKKL